MHTGGQASWVGRFGHLGGVALALAWLAGTALQLQQEQVLPAGQAWALLLGAVAVSVLGIWFSGRRFLADPGASAASLHPKAFGNWAPALLLAGLFCLGWASADLRASARLQQSLEPALEGQDLVLTGPVDPPPPTRPVGLRFVFAVDRAPRARPAGPHAGV